MTMNTSNENASSSSDYAQQVQETVLLQSNNQPTAVDKMPDASRKDGEVRAKPDDDQANSQIASGAPKQGIVRKADHSPARQQGIDASRMREAAAAIQFLSPAANGLRQHAATIMAPPEGGQGHADNGNSTNVSHGEHVPMVPVQEQMKAADFAAQVRADQRQGDAERPKVAGDVGGEPPLQIDVGEFLAEAAAERRGAKFKREVLQVEREIRAVWGQVPAGSIHRGFAKRGLITCGRSRFDELCKELFPDLFK